MPAGGGAGRWPRAEVARFLHQHTKEPVGALPSAPWPWHASAHLRIPWLLLPFGADSADKASKGVLRREDEPEE